MPVTGLQRAAPYLSGDWSRAPLVRARSAWADLCWPCPSKIQAASPPRCSLPPIRRRSDESGWDAIEGALQAGGFGEETEPVGNAVGVVKVGALVVGVEDVEVVEAEVSQ